LSERLLKIADLATDLADGVLLINLMEVISGKKIDHTKKPRHPVQKLENCGLAINFLTREGIKLVNIGGEDIYEKNEKLILGLIWTIILRYPIHA